MRASLTIGLILSALIAATWIAAQTRTEPKDKEVGKDEKKEESPPPPRPKKPAVDKPPVPLTSRAILARLQMEIDTEPLRESMRFKDLLSYLNDQMEDKDRAVVIDIDLAAFAEKLGADAPNPLEEEVQLRTTRKRVPIMDVLTQTMRQISKGTATFVIRSGRVEILPVAFTSKEYTLNQTFRADFKDQRLDSALEELTELTGVSIVVDARARQKAQATVTARFNNDVAMQDAVRMIVDMADLKIVYLATGIYVTTPEHATSMQRDLWKAYAVPEPAPLGPDSMPASPLGYPPTPNEPPPLLPPLPPPGRGGSRLDPAS